MDEEKGGRGFKVEDRRRFAADGEAREGGENAAEPAAAPSGEQASREQAPSRSGDPEELQALPEVTFEHFIISLSTQALVLLGEMPDPTLQAEAEDLPAAKQIIDILGMLQAKTKGNLDESESSLLESMLYNLRMQYVRKTRGK